MGRAGGFFKRLKAKRHREEKRRSRGTTGASKEARREKRNQLIDYYAARREADALAAISSSSEDVDVSSSDSDDAVVTAQDQGLQKLRRLVGASAGASSFAPTAAADGPCREEDGAENDGGDDEKGLDDWEAFVPEDDEEDDVEESEADSGADGSADVDEYREGGGGSESGSDDCDADSEGFFEDAEEEGEFDDEYEESDEESEADREDAFVDEDARPVGERRESTRQAQEELKVLLPAFKLGSSSLEVLKTVVDPKDAFFTKYHSDTHGGVDRTPVAKVEAPGAPEGAAAFAKAWSQVHDGVALSASSHAMRHLRQPPRQFFEAVALKPPPEASTPSRAACAVYACDASAPPPYVHPLLWEKWAAFRKRSQRPALTAGELLYMKLLQGYPDMLNCTRTRDNWETYAELHVLHLLNHWFKARSVVLANDRLLEARTAARRKTRRGPSRAEVPGARKGTRAAPREHPASRGGGGGNVSAGDDGDDEDDEDSDLELRDRGFGKTRLMIMLPMRNMALRYVSIITNVLGARPEDCRKLNVFVNDFSEVEEAADPTFKRRPKDYQQQFEGNIDDSFCFGMSLQTNKFQVYAHPLNSDVIICSPLGLRKRFERNGDCQVSLSSIEVCVVDEVHVLLMQNWEHLTAVLDLLNKRPKDTTSGLSDLRRVFPWALEGRSGRHRQTIIGSNITNATIWGTFREMLNNSGKVLLQPAHQPGVLPRVTVPVRQHFLRFDTDSLATCDADRFTYFTKEVYPSRLNPLVERNVRTIVFVPSYFDFIKVRNFFYSEYREFVATLSEYSTVKQQRKALGQFTDLEKPLLVVTERFYFFKRYFVKLAESLVFYSPPVFQDFYTVLVGKLVATSPNASVMTLFCRYDTHELHRLVGTQRLKQLLERESSAFSFITS